MLDTTQALDQFLMGIERRAFRIAMIATGNREDALDIVQEAMMKLAQRYHSRPETEWGPLFHTILQSKIRDWYRRSKIRNRWRQFISLSTPAQDDPEPEWPDPNAQPPEQAAVNNQLATALDKALHQLPLRQQQAFLLRAWEELNVNETADIMGCSAGSVKTHFSRAVNTLRKLMGQQHDNIR